MPLSEADLQFALQVLPDTAEVERAIEALGKKISITSRHAKEDFEMALKAWGANAKETKDFLDVYRKALKTSEAFDKMFGKITAIDAQMLAFKNVWKEINREASQMLDLEAKLEAMRDPTTFRQLVAEEKKRLEITREKAKLEEKIGFEAQRPGFFERLMGSGAGKHLDRALYGFQQGSKLNPGQLVGSMIGAGAEGGAGAAGGAGVGGAIGAGGPVAAVGAGLAVAVMALKKIGEAVVTPITLASKGFHLLADGLSNLNSALGPLGSALSTGGAVMRGIAGLTEKIPIVGQVAGALAGIPDTINRITSSLLGMVQGAAPGVWKQWTMVLEDIQSVIGYSFIGVLRSLTRAFREFADMLTKVLPAPEEMAERFEPVVDAFKGFGAAIGDLMRENGPTIITALVNSISFFVDIVSRHVKVLNTALSLLVGVLNFAVEKINKMITYLNDRLPAGMGIGLIPEIETGGFKTSQGGGSFKTARPAEMGGIAEYERKLQLSAYSSGMSPEQRTAKATEEINTFLKGKFGRVGQRAAEIIDRNARLARGYLRDRAGAAGDWFGRGVGGVFGHPELGTSIHKVIDRAMHQANPIGGVH